MGTKGGKQRVLISLYIRALVCLDANGGVWSFGFTLHECKEKTEVLRIWATLPTTNWPGWMGGDTRALPRFLHDLTAIVRLG